MPTTTTRRGFTRPALTDAPDIIAAVGTHLDQIDTQMGSITQGTLAARPVTGKDGDYYIARNDTTFSPNGTPYWWDSSGATWRSLKHVASHGIGGGDALVGAGLYSARPAANAVPAGFLYKATNAGTYISDGTNWSMSAPGFYSLSITTAPEVRTNSVYGLMATPDRISGLHLPPNGKFVIGFSGTWQNSVASAGRAAIFLGAVQMKATDGTTVAVQEATGSANINEDTHLSSYFGGLQSVTGPYSGDATVGMVLRSNNTLGGTAEVFATGGLYDVSLQFRSATGSVTVSNRKLWIEVWGV